MPDYPAGNDREYDLVKKIAENTAEIAAGGGGGGAVSSVNGDTGAVVVDAANLPASLKLTYTGAPQFALVLPFSPGIAIVPAATVSGQATYAAAPGPVITAFSYSEPNATLGNKLTALSFDDLVGVAGSFNPNTMTAITSLKANALVAVGLAFSPNTMAALTTLEMDALAYVGASFTPNAMASLTVLQVNALVTVGTAFTPATMAALTTLRANALVRVGTGFNPNDMASLTTLEANSLVSVGTSFFPNTMASLTTLSFPALAYIGTTFAPATMAACTSVSLPAMISYGSTISIPSASMANVAAFTMGTVGTLKSIAGATITLSGLKLPSSEVNAILALLVSLDGTNGTTLWGAGKTLLINGGTNGAPTGQGITDKATLVGRGATVTTN